MRSVRNARLAYEYMTSETVTAWESVGIIVDDMCGYRDLTLAGLEKLIGVEHHRRICFIYGGTKHSRCAKETEQPI